MTSPNITAQKQSAQLTLDLEPGLLDSHRSVRDVVATGVYRRGIKRTAADLDVSPGNLSSMLSDDSQRKFGVDDLERYVQSTGDTSPILWLCAKYLSDKSADSRARAQRLEMLMAELSAVVKSARV